jgi:MoaD family protein
VAIEVKVTSVLQRVIGAKSVEGSGATVAELLDDVNAKYPGFKEQITGADGSLHRFVNIYINDEDIRFLQSLDTPVKEGDVLSILPALAGGAGPQSGNLAIWQGRTGAHQPNLCTSTHEESGRRSGVSFARLPACPSDRGPGGTEAASW